MLEPLRYFLKQYYKSRITARSSPAGAFGVWNTIFLFPSNVQNVMA